MALEFSQIRRNTKFAAMADNIIQIFYGDVCDKTRDVIDGGANYGRHLFPLATAVPKGRVIGFEPLPDLADVLDARIKRLALDGRVFVRRQAISNRAGTADFTYFNEPNSKYSVENYNAAYSSLHPTKYSLNNIKHTTIAVEVVTIDTVVQDLGLDVQFIKLDLEGGEYHAMLGANDTLSTSRPIIVFEDGGPEVTREFGYDDIELLNLLNQHQYELLYLTGHDLIADEWLSRDYNENWRPNNIVAIPQEIDAKQRLRSAANRVAAASALPLVW